MSDIQLIRMLCPRLTCQQVLTVNETMRGKLVTCRRCRCVVRVPARRNPDAAPPASENASASPAG